MTNTEVVHKSKRVARGVRMDADLWSFIDDLAEIMTDGNASALIEKWASEKRDAVRSAA
jgi:hypothetical protein